MSRGAIKLFRRVVSIEFSPAFQRRERVSSARSAGMNLDRRFNAGIRFIGVLVA